MNFTPVQLEYLWSLARHAALVGVAAGLTALVQGVSGADFGFYGPLAVLLLSAVLKAVQKYVEMKPADPTPPKAPPLAGLFGVVGLDDEDLNRLAG